MITNIENKPMLRPPLNFSKLSRGRLLKTRQNGEESAVVASSGGKKEETDSISNNESNVSKFSGNTTLFHSSRSKTGLPPPSTTFKGSVRLNGNLENTVMPDDSIALNPAEAIKEEIKPRDRPNEQFYINNKLDPSDGKKEIGQRFPTPLRGKVNTNPSKTALAIDKMKQEREERRKRFAEARTYKQLQQSEAFEVTKYVEMINEIRTELDTQLTGTRRKSIGNSNASEARKDVTIHVCVRKRPLSTKESDSYAFDIATPVSSKHRTTLSRIYIHEPKCRLDLTKNIETHWFDFDEVFDENSSNMQIYRAVGKPLVEKVFEGGNSTLFAYGQTGSGKTHTIFGSSDGQHVGVYEYVCRDLFRMKENYRGGVLSITMCFFEIYGGKVFDLFSDRAIVTIQENGSGNIQVTGLKEVPVASLDEMLKYIEHGNQLRTTASTEANATSSRSHAIFQIILYNPGSSDIGKFSLIDLAGSERASESNSTTKQSQFEGAEINKSLLALKECIRALSIHGNSKSGYVPFRASKLTQVLRDALTGSCSNTVVIANISPSSLNCEHTLNTLRYAGRVKDLKNGSMTNNLTKKSTHALKPYMSPGTPSSVDDEHEHENDTDEDQSTFSSRNTDSDGFASTKEDDLATSNPEHVNRTPPSSELFRHRLASLKKLSPQNTEKIHGLRIKHNEPISESQVVDFMISTYSDEIPFAEISLTSRETYISQKQIRETNMEKGNRLIQENPNELPHGKVASFSKSNRLLHSVGEINDNTISPNITNRRHKLQMQTKTTDTNPLTPPPPFDPPTLSDPVESSKTSSGGNIELQESLDRLLKQQIYAMEDVDRLIDQERKMLMGANQLETTAIVEYPGKLEDILTEKIAVLTALKELVLDFKQKSRQIVAWEKLKTLD